MDSDVTKSSAKWLSAVSSVAFVAAMICIFIGFLCEHEDAVLAWEIAGVCLSVFISALFWAQLAHIRAGVEKTNELLLVISNNQYEAARSEPEKVEPKDAANKIAPLPKEHTDWLLACARADQQGLPRPAKPG